MAEFCPRDGTARSGAFRFCRTCGFDFDTAGTNAEPATPPTGQPDRQALMQAYRAQTGWTCLGYVMLVLGIGAGFLAGAFVAQTFITNGVLYLATVFAIGPFLGAVAGWYLWTRLWGRR